MKLLETTDKADLVDLSHPWGKTLWLSIELSDLKRTAICLE